MVKLRICLLNKRKKGYNAFGQCGESVEISELPLRYHFSCPCPLNDNIFVKYEGNYNMVIKSKSECQIFELFYFMKSYDFLHLCKNNEMPTKTTVV